MAAATKYALIATGATTNQTGAGVETTNIVEDAQIAHQLVVEAVGATPAITWKIQGSLDNANWYDCVYYTDANDTSAVAARTGPTAAGAQVQWLDSGNSSRMYRYWRAVISGITNTTYRVEMYAFNIPR